MIFTPKDVKLVVSETLKRDFIFKSHKVFEPDDFTSPSSEEFVHIITASKSEFEDILTFWIKCQEVMLNYFDDNRDEFWISGIL